MSKAAKKKQDQFENVEQYYQLSGTEHPLETVSSGSNGISSFIYIYHYKT